MIVEHQSVSKYQLKQLNDTYFLEFVFKDDASQMYMIKSIEMLELMQINTNIKPYDLHTLYQVRRVFRKSNNRTLYMNKKLAVELCRLINQIYPSIPNYVTVERGVLDELEARISLAIGEKGMRMAYIGVPRRQYLHSTSGMR